MGMGRERLIYLKLLISLFLFFQTQSEYFYFENTCRRGKIFHRSIEFLFMFLTDHIIILTSISTTFFIVPKKINQHVNNIFLLY
jgi:hypothetical protein